MRAVIMLKDSPHYRRDAFIAGVTACGFSVVGGVDKVKSSDLLIIWNRCGYQDHIAQKFEQAGALVLVAENGYLGADWRGETWYALSAGSHNGKGITPHSDGSRWRKYGFDLESYRTGTEIVFLPQRGIGEKGVAMPKAWEPKVNCRTRKHPGTKHCIPLREDLTRAKAVITWGSGAAIKAMAMGVPVFYGLDGWIAASGATHVDDADYDCPQQPDRLHAFESVLDGMWRLDEIESGEAISRVITCAS